MLIMVASVGSLAAMVRSRRILLGSIARLDNRDAIALTWFAHDTVIHTPVN